MYNKFAIMDQPVQSKSQIAFYGYIFLVPFKNFVSKNCLRECNPPSPTSVYAYAYIVLLVSYVTPNSLALILR